MDRETEFSRLVAIELAAEGKRKKITQKEIAKAAGFGSAQMSIYIAGTRGSMTLDALLGACALLGVPPEEIVARAYAALQAQLKSAKKLVGANKSPIREQLPALRKRET